jgi:hypothetical protein
MRQFPCAGQALSGSQIVAQNTQNDLSHQLFADADPAVMGKPELHAADILSALHPDGTELPRTRHSETEKVLGQTRAMRTQDCYCLRRRFGLSM